MDFRDMMLNELDARRMNKSDLATWIGCSPTQVTNWLWPDPKRRRTPSAKFWGPLAEFLHIDVVKLQEMLHIIPSQPSNLDDDPALVAATGRFAQILREHYEPEQWPRIVSLVEQVTALGGPAPHNPPTGTDNNPAEHAGFMAPDGAGRHEMPLLFVPPGRLSAVAA